MRHTPKLPIGRYRFTLLLSAEVAVIFSFPFTAGDELGAHIFRLLATILLAVCLYAVLKRQRTITLLAFLLGLPPIVIHTLNVFGYLLPAYRFGLLVGVVYLGFVTIVLLWDVLAEATVSPDTLAGAVASYLLIGITYGLAYGLIELFHPGAFRDTVNSTASIHPPNLIFFSFVTLTTVGYGDVVPISGIAKSLSIVEAVIGIMYPAVLIGRLIGLHVSLRRGS